MGCQPVAAREGEMAGASLRHNSNKPLTLVLEYATQGLLHPVM